MAISLASLRKASADHPARLAFYGPPGIGKTSLASEFPAPCILQTEEGTPGGATFETFGLLSTYRDLMQAIGVIYDNDLPFQTIILDSITATQALIYNETCDRGDEHGNKKPSIEAFGYGKGYVYAQKIMQELLDALNMLRREKGMTVIIIAHSKVERFDDPESVSYDQYRIDLHDRLRGMFEREMDCIFLMKSPVSVQKEDVGFNKERAVAAGGSQRWIHTTARPAFTAKNRYKMPEKIIYTEGKGYAELAKYLPATEQKKSARPEATDEAA